MWILIQGSLHQAPFFCSSSAVSNSETVSVIGTVCNLGAVHNTFWESLFPSRPSPATLALFRKDQPTLSWGGSLTAVPTELSLCPTGKGWLLWVIPLQLASVSSDDRGKEIPL